MHAVAADQYRALTTGVGLVDFCGRTRLEMTGADAPRHLHSFCTNDIIGLAPGAGCEAFITSVQGKILGHVLVLRLPEGILLETVPDQAETLIAHLDRYVLNADVQLHDRSQEWGEILLAGDGSGAILRRALGTILPEGELAGVEAKFGGEYLVVQRADRWVARPAALLCCAMATVPTLKERLLEAGAVNCDAAAFDAVRIEAGWPLFGRDITPENLPQEVDRDAYAISFKKGCYLGQETVARIDAMGHVNRKLRRLKFAGDAAPAPGTALLAGDKHVGEVTSAAISPNFGAPLALGYVRRGHNEPGTRLISSAGEVEVLAP